jgi:phosphoglycolate phosphatase-like HAD superfamily hydrolase
VSKRTIVIWDIDNTLLYTGGAGSVAMARAFHELYGVEDAFGRVEFSGRSDRAISRDAAVDHGISGQALAAELVRFVDAYVPQLAVALQEVRGALMPGILAILSRLDARQDVVQGLGTGNFRRTGIAKLQRYDIAAYFPGAVGGFGDDHESRDEIIRIGIARVQNGGGPDRVVVVGDTPHDVTAAKANGAYALAVATGRDSIEGLLSCGADAALSDLTDTDGVMSLILDR